MSPCGTYEACRCCHRFLVLFRTFLQVFLVFHVHVSSISIFWAVFTCKVNVYHKNCFSWLRGNLCQFPCGSEQTGVVCLFLIILVFIFFSISNFLGVKCNNNFSEWFWDTPCPGVYFDQLRGVWKICKKQTFSRCSLFHWYPPREILHRQ